MFTKHNIRLIVAIIWALMLCILILIQILALRPFRIETMSDIGDLEYSIVNKDWDRAIQKQNEIEMLWKTKKILVQINNLTPAVSKFEQNLEALKVLVNQHDDKALIYLGALKHTFDSITSIFPTPEG